MATNHVYKYKFYCLEDKLKSNYKKVIEKNFYKLLKEYVKKIHDESSKTTS